jgi:hypothetical protein
MSYDLIETSEDSGAPLEFYEFKLGNRAWYYTSADSDQWHNGNTYQALPITHGDIRSASEASQANLTLTVPGNIDLTQVFLVTPPSDVMSLTIVVRHQNGLSHEYIVVWKGRVLSAEWGSESTAELTCESIFSSLQRAGVRRRAQTSCPFDLYGTDCGVSRALFEETGTVNLVNGRTIDVLSAAGKPENWYAGGMLIWTNSTGNTERTFIKLSSSALGRLTLANYPLGLVVGQAVAMAPGCDRTRLGANGCIKFNNTARYGGFVFMPTKKPFSGVSMF